MLYVSTRNKADSFTSYRALHSECAPDGGLFVPFRMRPFGDAELNKLLNKPFSDAVASVLNHFFSAQLTGWDVEFCIGRTPVKIETAGYKVTVAELWHNHEGTYKAIKNTLYSRLCGASAEPAGWASVAIDIAILFGTFTLFSASDRLSVDIALPEDNYSGICAAWYGRKMGLPIGNILFVCKENSPIWDFVLHGELSTAALKAQGLSEGMIERILYDVFGHEEAAVYLERAAEGRQYCIDEELLPQFNAQLYAAAVGKGRAENVINSVKRSSGYKISCDAAFCFGGVQDYRSATGVSVNTLVLSTVKSTD